MGTHYARRIRFHSVVWITMLLLQECRHVLLMNVDAMKTLHTHQVPDHRTTQEKSLWSSSKAKNAFKNKETKHRRVASAVWDEEMASSNVRLKRSTSSEDQIEKIMFALKEKGKQTNLFGETYDALQKVACDETQVSNLKTFWKKNNIFYIFYLTSAALTASISTCYDVMRKHVADIVESGSGDDALQLLEDVPSIIASIDDMKHSRNKRSILETSAVNPESPENHKLKQMQRILAESVTKVHEFSKILFTYTNNENFTISPEIEESLDHTILEFDEMSASLYQEPVLQRPKRISDSYKTLYYSEHNKKTAMPVKYKRDVISLNNENPVKVNFQDSKSDSRKRRALSEMDNVVIIQNEKYPCKVLSVCTHTSLCFEDYSEEHMQRFLWIWKDNRLRNLETMKFLYGELYDEEISLHDDLNDDHKIHFNNGSLIVGNNTARHFQCSFHAYNDPQLVSVKIVCGKIHQKWSLLSFNDVKNNIIAVACLFFLQDINTCLVFTPHESNGTVYISMEPVADGDGIIKQLWQWDGQLIKHYDSQNYLTAKDIENPVSLTTKEDKSWMQQWAFEDNQFRVTNFQQNLYPRTETGIVFVSKTPTKTIVQLNATRTDNNDCNARSLSFVIKHTSKPCEVLCVRGQTTKADISFRFIIAFASFVVGAFFGMLTNLCTNSQRAVKIAISLGVVLSATSVLSFQYKNILSNDYFTLTFETFDHTNPSKCLWHDHTGTIRSLINNQSLDMEQTIYGRTVVARLVEQSNQMWVLENGSLTNSDGFSWDLDFSENGMRYDHSTALFNFVMEPRVIQSWTKVEYDTNDTSNFMKEVNCLYFLRHMTNKSCSLVSSYSSKSDYSLLSPTENETILDNLWFTASNSTINAATGIIFQENIIDYEKIPLNNTHSVFSLCQNTMYFIRSVEFPCKVLTEIQIGNTFKLIFQEYNPDKFLNQVWNEVDGFIHNFGTGRKMTGEDVQGIFSENCKWKNDSIECGSTYCMLSGFKLQHQTNIICSHATDPVKWTKVPFDEDLNVMDEIMCIYFVQNQGPHFAYLTADSSSGEVFLEYMASDVINNQLWFKVNDRLVHLESGLSLSQDPLTDKITINNLTDVNFSLSFADSKIVEKFSGEILAGFASVRFVSDHQVLINGSQFWSFININVLETEAGNLQREPASRSFFFLKNSINSCKLLTVDYNGELTFKVFEEDLLENQLWYIENGRLFNVFTAKVLSIQDDDISLNEMLVFDKTQVIYRHQDKLVHVLNSSHVCYISYDTNGQDSRLSCQHTDSLSNSWTLIYYEENSNDVHELYCLYLIRNKAAPCEFITYTSDAPLKVRPTVQELVNNQLFFWKDENIVHLETGLLLTAMMDRSSSVTLESYLESNTSFQSWKVLGDQIVPSNHYYLALEADIADDGIIVLAKSFCKNTTDKTQQWSIIKADDNVDYASLTNECAVNETATGLRFFIRSTQNRCLVLRGGDLGQSPRFEVFDLDEMDHFLWIKQNDHIINVYSGLALMLDYEEDSIQQTVIMWHHYAFAKAQKWSMSENKIKSFLKQDCILISLNTGKEINLATKCESRPQTDIDAIEYSEDGEFISDITCRFFIKSNAEHCELLTNMNGGEVKTRPLNENSLDNQLWFWKGQHIVSFRDNRMLTLSNQSHRVKLDTLNGNATLLQTWIYSNLFFKNEFENDNYLTISENSGDIVVTSLKEPNALQQWMQIDLDEVKNNPHALACPQSNPSKSIYIVRSDYESCPVLAALEDNKITAVRYSESSLKASLWLKDREHIINAENGTCLQLVESNVRGNKVFLQQKYYYEKSQKWSTEGNRIYSQSAKHSQYLTYTGSDILMLNLVPNDQQIWKWYTLQDIQTNDKLLRCSRCYNKAEETAAEVISYIPVISFFYNLVRSATYAGLNCPEVAIDSLKDLLIDVAFDVIVALSAGTASAFAYGVKTGLKFGFKAGAKAVKTALKSMIKVSFNSVRSSFSGFIQRGGKKTLKTSMKNISSKSRSVMLSVKHKIATARRIKNLHFLDLKSAMKNKLKFVGSFKEGTSKLHSLLKSRFMSFKKQLTLKTFKTRLNDLNNLLSKRAEHAIKKSDIFGKQKTFLRCRRTLEGCQSIDFSGIWNNNVELPPLPDDIKRDLEKLDNVFDDKKGQFASIGLKSARDDFIYKNHAEIGDLKNAKPKYKNEISPEMSLTNREEKANVMHAEQRLLENIDNEVKVHCNQAAPCKVVMYTKMSPCENRLPRQAITCLDHIQEKCSEWFIHFATSCVITFKKYWYNDVFDKSFDDNIAALMGMKTLPSGKQATDPELLWGESLNDFKLFIKENLDNIKADMYKLEKSFGFTNERIEEFGKSLQEAIDAVKPDNADLSAFWDTLFKHYSSGSGHTKIAIELKLKVVIRETLNHEAKRRKVTKILNDISEKNGSTKFYHVS